MFSFLLLFPFPLLILFYFIIFIILNLYSPSLSFTHLSLAMVKGSIDGRRDLCGGRKSTDEFTAAHSMAGKFFRSICYSTDGEFVIGGGQSKYICIYELRGKSLVRKYALTQNLSLEVR